LHAFEANDTVPGLSKARKLLPIPKRVTVVPALLAWLATGVASAQPVEDASGTDLYNYYCFQCHGYSGDARTLAASYMDPRPRDFTASSREELTTERMLAVLETGKPGTGMVSFANTLTPAQRLRIVGYIEDTFLGEVRGGTRYHTVENGWPDHQRYLPAFPFATGQIALDAPDEALDEAQRRGRQLYLSACITCHDRARVIDEGPVWGLHAVSYPRRLYTSAGPPPESISAASPYAMHDVPPTSEGMSERQRLGQTHFLANCAFCHGADASGQNWIGSFLVPRPRDLTALDYRGAENRAQIEEVIRNGLPGTSMPAWGAVLDDAEIGAIMDYLAALYREGKVSPTRTREVTPPALGWQKQSAISR